MRIHYYKTDTLEAIARNILTRINSNYMNLKPQAVPIESLIEDIYNLNIDYKYLKQFKDELGKMVYDNGFVICFNREKDDYEFLDVTSGTMLIESTLAEDPAQYGRLRFTLAHELAHWILHQNLFKGTGIAAAMYDETDKNNAAEWQANYLAQAILMPSGQIKRCFYDVYEKSNNSKDTIETMANIFEVSRQAMEIRLKNFKLVD